jgi:primary-amine oxidase
MMAKEFTVTPAKGERRVMRSLLATVLLVLSVAANAATHPLDPLSADEHRSAYDVVRAHFAASSSLPDEPLLFPFVALREPAKSFVRSWNGAGEFPREATVHVLHFPSNRLWIATVDLTAARVSRLELAPAGTTRRRPRVRR